MRKLRVQLFLTVAFGVLVINALFAVIILSQLVRLPEAFREGSVTVAKARATEISSEIEHFSAQLELLITIPEVQMLDEVIVTGLLRDMADTQPFVRNYTLIDLDGNAISTDNRRFNVAEQQQYQDIVIDRLPRSISDPFISPNILDEGNVFIIAREIIKDGELVGILNAVVTLESLDSIVNNISLQADGYGFLVNEELVIIAHRDPERLFTKLYEGSFHNTELILLDQLRGDFVFEENGNRREGFYAQIESNPDWFLVLSFDARAISAPYRNAINTFIVGLSVLIGLAVLQALYFSNSLSKPILALQKTFDKAAQGNLNVIADDSLNNEIGDAARSFNIMIRQIKQLTYYDPITGLYNLNTFLLELPRFIHHPEIAHRTKGIVIISIDDFKKLNTISGHETGDKILKKLADMVESHLGVREIVGRFYGDEMILFMHAEGWTTLKTRIETLFEMIHQPFNVLGNRFALRVSVGVSELENHHDYMQTIHQATIAKLQVKKAGGNAIEYYNDHINYQLIEEQNMEEALVLSVQEQEFELYYQPIIDVEKNKVVGYEALLRWLHPDYQSVPVIRVIQLAERLGVIHTLGAWIIDQALSDLKKLKRHHDVYMSINISTLQLNEQDFYDHLKQQTALQGLSPHEVTLEITETHLMSTTEFDLNRLLTLKESGFMMAIDDFGTGYSSLAYLSTFPFDFLKIDRRFISQMAGDKKAQDIVSTILSLGNILDLQVVAEGVETEQEFKMIKAMNCHFSQGYYHARPKPLQAILNQLTSENKT